MTKSKEVTRKGGVGPDSCPEQSLNAVAELHACNASEQPGRAPEKGRLLAPAARRNAGAGSTMRSQMCRNRGQRVKASGVNVDKQEAARFNASRQNLISHSASVITPHPFIWLHGETL